MFKEAIREMEFMNGNKLQLSKNKNKRLINIASINIRGRGSVFKRKSLSQVFRKGNVDLCFVQETKATHMDDLLVRGLWGDQNFEW